jgi:hypothetical protein
MTRRRPRVVHFGANWTVEADLKTTKVGHLEPWLVDAEIAKRQAAAQRRRGQLRKAPEIEARQRVIDGLKADVEQDPPANKRRPGWAARAERVAKQQLGTGAAKDAIDSLAKYAERIARRHARQILPG